MTKIAVSHSLSHSLNTDRNNSTASAIDGMTTLHLPDSTESVSALGVGSCKKVQTRAPEAPVWSAQCSVSGGSWWAHQGQRKG